ncbi:inositol monophosphatase [Halobacteriales archaeon SW_12_71_31]|nr:MAG: inositol monophosphatase [Halobacteriales archaeon SW_12_71_31]
MHGRTLATTEEILAVVSPDCGGVDEQLAAWAEARDLGYDAVDVGVDVGDLHDPEATTLGVAIGGDGTFLEAVKQFAPREVPVLGINTGTLAFLTRVSPADMDEALTEVIRGRAEIAQRQQLRATVGDRTDAVGINDVIVQAQPPEDPTDRKICRLHAYVDGEYVGQYDGNGLVVGTPTGSTGISLSANGPVHYPEDNFTLQLVPLDTHRMGARPVVVGADSEIAIVPEDDVELLVDGGRAHATLSGDDEVRITGSAFAELVRTSYDDEFFSSIAEKLGWGLREDSADVGPVERLGREPEAPDVLERARQIAMEAAESAGEPLRSLHGRVESVEVKSDKSDIVTEADYRAERIITTVIENEFPEHNIRSEESVEREHDSEYTWLVDPLDGTGNFAHGNPNYSVSIGLLEGEDPVMGVVYAPETREMFSAVEGREAYESGSVISTTDRDSLDESMLLSGYDPDGSFLTRFYQATRGVRRLGSVALNLCYLASGSADAVWEYDTYPWDVAAGLVIARTAGARITDGSGAEFDLALDEDDTRFELLGTNGTLHDDVLAHLQGADADLVDPDPEAEAGDD